VNWGTIAVAALVVAIVGVVIEIATGRI